MSDDTAPASPRDEEAADVTAAPAQQPGRSSRHTVEVPASVDMVALLGSRDELLRVVERAFARVDVLVDDAELAERRRALAAAGGYAYPASQTPWQEIQRAVVGQMNTGAILEGAEKYQRIAQTMGLPRDNH